jgi:hypothetical protein
MMVLCSSLDTVQSTLETVQGMCMGEYAAATGAESDTCAGTPATAAAKAGADNKTTITADAATAATSSSTSASHSPTSPPTLLSSSKNDLRRSNNESSRWSIGTQAARTFPSDRFMEFPFFGNNSLYDEDDHGNDDINEEEDERNLFKEETAAFFRSCYAGGGDCLAMPENANEAGAAAAAAAAEQRNLRSAANMLFSVDTVDDGSSLRTPWTTRMQQHQQAAAAGRPGGATARAATAPPTRQEPRYLQKPWAAAASRDDIDVAVIPNRHSSPKRERVCDLDRDQQQLHHAASSQRSAVSTGTRSKRKKRPTYIVLYRPRTPWPLERLDVVWSYQRILDYESSTSSPSLTSPSSLQLTRRGGGSGRLTPEQPCTTTNSSNMDLWTGLLQDEERVEIGRITGYSIHSSQLLDQLVHRSSSSSNRRHHHNHQHAVVADPAVMHFAKTILNTTGASSAAGTTPTTTTTTTTTTTETTTLSSSSDAGDRTSPTRRRPDMGPIFLITNVYICPEYRGTGLGLFLVDVACRRVADPLALVVLSCGNNSMSNSSSDDARQDPANETSSPPRQQREVVQLYFGLLGFAPISEQFFARRNGRHCPRVEEVCPHMPRNMVADSTTATATEVVASSANERSFQLQQTPMRRRQLPLSLAPPS